MYSYTQGDALCYGGAAPLGRVFKIRIIFMFKLFIKTPHNLL